MNKYFRNFTLFANNSNAAARSFQTFPSERPSQSAAEAMDKNGILFFGLMTEIAIGCWNSKNFNDFGDQNVEILLVNPETLQFASGLKVNRQKKLGKLTKSNFH